MVALSVPLSTWVSVSWPAERRVSVIVGLAFGVVTLTWAFSGLLSMGPFDFVERLFAPASKRGPNIAAALRGSTRFDLTAFAAKSPAAGIVINAAGYSAMQRAAAGNTCAAAGGWVTPIKRSDGTALSGSPPNGINVTPVPTQIVFGTTGQVTSGPPAALLISPFTVTIDPISGLVSVQ